MTGLVLTGESLNCTASNAIGKGTDMGLGNDIGAVQFKDSPVSTKPVIYSLNKDGFDDNGHWDLNGFGNIAHTGGGLVCDDADDGHYQGKIFNPDKKDQQLTVLVAVDFVAHNGKSPQILVSRADWPGGLNWLLAADPSGVLRVSLGYNNGDNAKVQKGSTVIPTDKPYWLWATIDGGSKVLNMGILDQAGNTIGKDVNNRTILAGKTWNYDEGDLVIGGRLVKGHLDGRYSPNGTIYHVELSKGVILKSTLIERVKSINVGNGTKDEDPGEESDGDLDGDSDVDSDDLKIIVGELGNSDCSPTTPCNGDLDNDNDVDKDDLEIFAKNLKAMCVDP